MPQPPRPARHVAFLRAINVGGHTVKMDRLRALFEELGLSGVETFIASGNVIFHAGGEDAAALERRIEAHLRASLGYEVATFLRTPAELAAALAHRPFGDAEDAEDVTLFLAFLHAPPLPEAVAKLLASRTEDDDFAVHGREVYWLRRGRSSDSDFSGAKMEKALGMPGTMRNVSTVRKLAAKYAD